MPLVSVFFGFLQFEYVMPKCGVFCVCFFVVVCFVSFLFFPKFISFFYKCFVPFFCFVLGFCFLFVCFNFYLLIFGWIGSSLLRAGFL